MAGVPGRKGPIPGDAELRLYRGKYTVAGGDPRFSARRYTVRCANVVPGLGLYFGTADVFSVIAELAFGIGSTPQTLGIIRVAYAFRVPRWTCTAPRRIVSR